MSLTHLLKKCLWIIALVLTLSGVVFGDGAESESVGSPLTSTSNTSGWMVTAIIFILLFVIALSACIYLCVERRRTLNQFFAQRNVRIQAPVKHQHGSRTTDGGADGYF